MENTEGWVRRLFCHSHKQHNKYKNPVFSSPSAVPHTAERTHPCAFARHGHLLFSAAVLQLPQVLMPA